LDKYGVTFEYLPGKKHVSTFADALSRLIVHSLKIHENKEELTLLSKSENNSISNIK
jgi:hypothetical protein